MTQERIPSTVTLSDALEFWSNHFKRPPKTEELTAIIALLRGDTSNRRVKSALARLQRLAPTERVPFYGYTEDKALASFAEFSRQLMAVYPELVSIIQNQTPAPSVLDILSEPLDLTTAKRTPIYQELIRIFIAQNKREPTDGELDTIKTRYWEQVFKNFDPTSELKDYQAVLENHLRDQVLGQLSNTYIERIFEVFTDEQYLDRMELSSLARNRQVELPVSPTPQEEDDARLVWAYRQANNTDLPPDSNHFILLKSLSQGISFPREQLPEAVIGAAILLGIRTGRPKDVDIEDQLWLKISDAVEEGTIPPDALEYLLKPSTLNPLIEQVQYAIATQPGYLGSPRRAVGVMWGSIQSQLLQMNTERLFGPGKEIEDSLTNMVKQLQVYNTEGQYDDAIRRLQATIPSMTTEILLRKQRHDFEQQKLQSEIIASQSVLGEAPKIQKPVEFDIETNIQQVFRDNWTPLQQSIERKKYEQDLFKQNLSVETGISLSANPRYSTLYGLAKANLQQQGKNTDNDALIHQEAQKFLKSGDTIDPNLIPTAITTLSRLVGPEVSSRLTGIEAEQEKLLRLIQTPGAHLNLPGLSVSKEFPLMYSDPKLREQLRAFATRGPAISPFSQFGNTNLPGLAYAENIRYNQAMGVNLNELLVDFGEEQQEAMEFLRGNIEGLRSSFLSQLQGPIDASDAGKFQKFLRNRLVTEKNTGRFRKSSQTQITTIYQPKI